MTYHITLSPAMKQELAKRLKEEKQVKIHRRLKCIGYKEKGIDHQDIALMLDITKESVTNWIKLFIESGFEGLCHLRYEGRRPSKLEPVKEIIKERIRLGKVPTVMSLSLWLQKNHCITIQESGLFKFLKKNSLVLKNPPDSREITFKRSSGGICRGDT